MDIHSFSAFAATLLAEAGAQVVKLEPATGDPGRRNWKATYAKAKMKGCSSSAASDRCR